MEDLPQPEFIKSLSRQMDHEISIRSGFNRFWRYLSYLGGVATISGLTLEVTSTGGYSQTGFEIAFAGLIPVVLQIGSRCGFQGYTNNESGTN